MTVNLSKILIANRGEIAVRVIRAARELGLETVQVFSEADRDSLAAKMADEAIEIGPPLASESYLNVDAVLKAAINTGVDAIHPGYGFLSENADFADAVAAAGIRFHRSIWGRHSENGRQGRGAQSGEECICTHGSRQRRPDR